MKETGMMTPFANESECLQVGGLTVENRLDRISLYGSLDLTCDQAGLARARQLLALLQRTVAALEEKELPEQLVQKRTEQVKNLFS